MNNFNTFMHETSIGRFLIPIGIILIAFSIFAFISVDHAKNFIKTEAIVTKTVLYEEAHYDIDDNYVEATYTVFVRYTVDNTNYEEEYGIFSEYKKGDKVTIAYNPENPKEIVQPNTIVLPLILLGLGITSIIGGIINIVKIVKKHKNLKSEEV